MFVVWSGFYLCEALGGYEVIEICDPSVDPVELWVEFFKFICDKNCCSRSFDILDVACWLGGKFGCFDQFFVSEELVCVWVLGGLVCVHPVEFGGDRWRFVERRL